MTFHQEMQAQAGVSSFGNALRLREQARDGLGWLWVDQTEQDLRYGFRKLWVSPGFSLGTILMLAVGIGINLATFSCFNLLVLRPLPIRDPQSLLHFEREDTDSFSTSPAGSGFNRSNLRINDELQTSAVSALGVVAMLGAVFSSLIAHRLRKEPCAISHLDPLACAGAALIMLPSEATNQQNYVMLRRR